MNRVRFWIAPALAASLAVAFYGPFGFGRDFIAWLVAVFLVLPAIGMFLVVSGGWLILDRNPRRREIARSSLIAALAPSVLIPALWFFGDQLRDPARYAVWATLHPNEIEAARQHDGIFKHWDDWGMAGNESDSYLASDPTDTLDQPGVGVRWANAHRLGCDLVGVRRMNEEFSS
jgi:hypothetical protein